MLADLAKQYHLDGKGPARKDYETAYCVTHERLEVVTGAGVWQSIMDDTTKPATKTGFRVYKCGGDNAKTENA